jgi:hypothetical protein
MAGFPRDMHRVPGPARRRNLPGGDLRRASTCDLPQPASRRALPHPRAVGQLRDVVRSSAPQVARHQQVLLTELSPRFAAVPRTAAPCRGVSSIHSAGSGPRSLSRRPGARAQLGGEAAARASAQARASAASSTATSAWSTAQAA